MYFLCKKNSAEGVFFDVIGTKILRLLLLAIHRGVLSKDFWLGGPATLLAML
jgi:hypothetical protein